jgi:polysaccharide export outer membrane protein
MRRIELRRDGRTVSTLDLYELLLKGDKSHDAGLLPGDVVYIPTVGPLAAMVGSVNLPGIYELSVSTTLEQGIDWAGGLTTTADNQQVSLVRIAEHHVRRVMDVRLDGSEKQFAMHDGDIVRFIAVSPAIENAVTLRGNVAHPGRYRWHAGMRIHDLIPTRGFLLTREYWENKNKLGRIDAPDPLLTQKDQEQKDSEEDPQPSREGNKRQNEAKAKVWQSAGEFATEIKRNAPELNWDYAAVQRTNASDLTAELLPFNLAKAIDSDAANDLVLEAGDVVTIFSERDIAISNLNQTKLVRLEGEFTAPGVYRCIAGEMLRQLVTRVGLTSESYLYGAEFTRESTRAQQQQGFDRMLAEMEKTLPQIAAQRADAPVNPATAEGVDARRSLLERLRTLRPSGRIVLALSAESRDPQRLPDIVLEDGDRFVVPHQPATVGVTGEVFNQGSFLHDPKMKVGDYVRNAGGPTRASDPSRMFVLRADGTVISRQKLSRKWGAGFDDLRVYPGDAIIVPLRLERGAFMRGLRDWTQVVSNFALGAAAIKVLQ